MCSWRAQKVVQLKSMKLLMVNHYPAEFGGHRRCSSQDKMVLVVEGHNSTCFHFNPPLLFISKASNLLINLILVARFMGNVL